MRRVSDARGVTEEFAAPATHAHHPAPDHRRASLLVARGEERCSERLFQWLTDVIRRDT